MVNLIHCTWTTLHRYVHPSCANIGPNIRQGTNNVNRRNKGRSERAFRVTLCVELTFRVRCGIRTVFFINSDQVLENIDAETLHLIKWENVAKIEKGKVWISRAKSCRALRIKGLEQCCSLQQYYYLFVLTPRTCICETFPFELTVQRTCRRGKLRNEIGLTLTHALTLTCKFIVTVFFSRNSLGKPGFLKC